MRVLFFGLISVLFFGLHSVDDKNIVYKSKNLVLEQVSASCFVHVSFLETAKYGKVGCNGLVYIDRGEAIVFDSPIDDFSSLELINWIEKEKKCKIRAVVPTHFHVDCLGGLEAFHKRKIKSIANKRTPMLAFMNGAVVPKFGFDKFMRINNTNVELQFLGEGHTKDNIVAYIPSDSLLFGGCLIKSLGAAKGNLDDANTSEWPITVRRLRFTYPHVKVVVPGHGRHGGKELLDYTIKLFD